MKKLLIAALMAATTVAVAAPGEGPFAGGKRGPGGRQFLAPASMLTTETVEKLAKKLELNDEQKAKVEAIVESSREQIRDVGEKAKADVMAVLTPDQQDKAKDLAGDMKDRAAVAGKGRGARAAEGKPQQMQERMRERMQAAGEFREMQMAVSRLDLTDEQKEKLKVVRDEMEQAGKAIRDEMKPKIEALQKEAREKLDGVLTEEQREQLKKELSEIKENRPADMMGRGFPGMGGGRGAGMHMRGPRGPMGPGGPNAPVPQD
jgi:hypothetical protein